MTKQPSLSVILPIYNAETFVSECIDSILNQSFSDFELNIIDDGSSDASASLVRKYVDHRINFYSRKNKGLGLTLNELILMSKSNLIVRMDADDVMLPERLRTQYNFMLEHTECVLSGMQIKYYNGKVQIDRTPFPQNDEQIRTDLKKQIFSICHPALIFRKDIATRVGMYKIHGIGEDLDFFLRMSECGQILNTGEYGLLYRFSQNSITSKKKYELRKIYAFTIQKLNNPVLDWETFNQRWEMRSSMVKATEFLEILGDKFFEKHILYFGIQNWKSRYFLFLSAICKPSAVLRHLQRRLFRK